MQNLVISMLRFSAAVTLYGFEQLQTTMYVTQGGEDLPKVMDKLEIAFNSLTESLLEHLDQNKKDTLKSFTGMAKDIVAKSFDSVSYADPRELLKAAGEMVQKGSGAVSDFFGKQEAAEEASPQPAAEVLS